LPFAPFITGKTLLAKTLAHFVNVPFVIADATAITQVIMESSIVPIFVIILSVRDNKQTKLTVRDAFFFLI
jgi:SpoVK/Ycf46/Vps4 family AAA+-type ATPase